MVGPERVAADGKAAIRPVRLPEDHAALLGLDRSFTTDRIYHVARTADSFTLQEAPVTPPLRRAFPLADDLGTDRTWEQGFVAEQNGGVVGFAAFTHQRWNRRTEFWHLYIAPKLRGQGTGRALVEAVIADAREAGTRCVWLETSNIAYPAIQFYRRVGFVLCGLDASLYDPTGDAAGETALYFVRSV